MKKTAGRFGRGPFSRAAKKEDEVDDLLNSDAFLNKKVQMLQKQIKATQQDTVTARAQADEQWAEWGPQVSRAAVRYGLVLGFLAFARGVDLWLICGRSSMVAAAYPSRGDVRSL